MSQEFEKIAKIESARAVLTHETEHMLRALSCKKRKTPSVLVLGRDGFSDNSKYLYLAMASRSLGFPVYWGTFDQRLHAELTARGLPAVNLAGNASDVVSFLFEIACVVYCTNPIEATRSPLFRAALAGAHKFQLWHGIGLKTIDLQNTASANMLNVKYLNQMMGVIDIDEVLSPSSLYDDQWREAFGVERVLRAGFPRNEVLVRPATDNELLGVAQLPGEFIEKGFILFAPTFTPLGTTPIWAEPRLLGILESLAQHVGVGLAIKPHPFDRPPPDGMPKRGPSVAFLGAGSDVYPLLRHARAMVTDFSSMASDFLLCDKPILFFRSKTLEDKSYPPRCMPELPGLHVREETAKAFATAWDSIGETEGARNRLKDLYFETDPLEANNTVIRRLSDVVTGKS